MDCEVLTILKLDEKKVRKGKPLGLPYVGSKKKISKKNIVLISSYEVSDPRFEAVYEFPGARSTINRGMKGDRHEKLFMARR